MEGMMNLARTLLSSPRSALMLFGGISALALGMALIAQYVYGLQPCVLCVFQRWPFVIVIVLAAFGIYGAGKFKNVIPITLSLTTLTFAANAVIAFYHTGVERHWWKSFLEGCAVPDMKGNITDVLAQIQAAPVVRCDEIPWTDPVFGLSMANYNVALCLVLAAAALWALKHRKDV